MFVSLLLQGRYCNATFGPVESPDAYICPSGYYCPDGTEYDTQYPCPLGTFNNITGNVYPFIN